MSKNSFYYHASIDNLFPNNTNSDIRNLDDLKSKMISSKPSIVIHLAAQPLVLDSYLDPVTTYSTNIMGTINLFEAVRENASVKVVLNVTSDKCYDNKEHLIGYKEDDPMGGNDPYSCSKGCSELISSSYSKSYLNDLGIGVATARSGNVIGGGDWSDNRIIPDAIQAFQNNKKLLVRNPNSIRPWQHVLEPLSGYLLLCEQLLNNPKKYSGAWNFGPNEDEASTVAVIADSIAKSWRNNAQWQVAKGKYLHEANYLKLDCAKSHKVLKWKPRLTLEESILETVNWYKAFYNKEDMNKFSLNQIANFIK
jgi:CDP-glucose 4,6-dehydratase